ncbi:MAG: hypothetical protein HYZ53_28530 [Planctomycetes bacterium]|nr:hypothetical protein [Planctomycetota bacterium]
MSQRRQNIDPELVHQLNLAATSGKDFHVQAVFSLTRTGDAKKPIPPAETVQRVEALLGRIQEVTRVAPRRVNVLRNLGSFVLDAPPIFIAKLLEDEEVATATANLQPREMLIRPVKSKPTELS